MSKVQRPGQEESAPPSGEIIETIEPPDPNERLKQLQTELDQHTTRIDHLSKQRSALQNDINDLSTTVQQVKTTVTNFGAGLKDLHTRLQALEYFYHQKSKMILAAIGDKKAPIDDLVRLYDEEIGRMQDRLRELDERQSAAQEESNEAARVQNARQKEYDTVNNYQQDVTNKLTEMEALRVDITQADDITDVATMYFLVLEFHARLRETQIISQHQLSMDLRQKLGELEAAKEHARTKSAALSAVQGEYAAYKTDLDNKRAGRRTKLLAEVEAMFPVPTESGTASAATPTPASGTGSSTPATPGPATPSPSTTQKK